MDTTSSSPVAEAQERFVAAWGQMGSAWGISRTMAEVHALLYVTGDALCTDDVMDRLSISRGNASMSLRALVDWGIVHRAHKRGDRKEYFEAEQDVWTMFRAIVRGRLQREVAPLVDALASARSLTPTPEPGTATSDVDQDSAKQLAEHNERLDAIHGCFQMLLELAERFAGPSGEGLEAATVLLHQEPSGTANSEPADPGNGARTR